MSQKSQRGLTNVELTILILVLFILGGMVIPAAIHARHKVVFKEIFGVEIYHETPLSKEKIQVIQPLVIKRLQELDNDLQIAQKEKATILAQETTTTATDTTQKIHKINEVESKITSASNTLVEAKKLAEYFGFKTSH